MDSKEYRKFTKRNYKQFNVYLRKEEYAELIELLKLKQISQVDFVRNAIKDLKKML